MLVVESWASLPACIRTAMVDRVGQVRGGGIAPPNTFTSVDALVTITVVDLPFHECAQDPRAAIQQPGGARSPSGFLIGQ